MMSIEEYGKVIGAEITTFDGNFYVRLVEYERLLRELKELKDSNIQAENGRGEEDSL